MFSIYSILAGIRLLRSILVCAFFLASACHCTTVTIMSVSLLTVHPLLEPLPPYDLGSTKILFNPERVTLINHEPLSSGWLLFLQRLSPTQIKPNPVNPSPAPNVEINMEIKYGNFHGRPDINHDYKPRLPFIVYRMTPIHHDTLYAFIDVTTDTTFAHWMEIKHVEIK